MAEDKIAKTLGIVSMDVVDLHEDHNGELVPINEKSTPQGTDFDDVREQIREIAQLGRDKLIELGEVASQSQHPRAYEAFTELLKASVQAQRDLLEIQRTQIDIEQKRGDAPQEIGKVVNNNLLVFKGSTKELLEQMRELGK